MDVNDDLKRAFHAIAANPGLSDFLGPVGDASIADAEASLSVKFPPTYRQFLKRYGAGSFGGQEIYGVVGRDGVPDVVWTNLRLRESGELGKGTVAINAVGNGQLICLESRADDDPQREQRVVAVWPGSEDEGVEEVAPHFGAFLVDLVKTELDENSL
jgi:antitoxin YobK